VDRRVKRAVWLAQENDGLAAATLDEYRCTWAVNSSCRSPNSYMYNSDRSGNISIHNEVFGFSAIYAESFARGIDFAYIYDSSHNVTSGFVVLLQS
jgi:hypothetical protein